MKRVLFSFGPVTAAALLMAVTAGSVPPTALPDDTIAIRPVAHLCMTHDARFVSDEEAATFLAEVKVGLEEARFLFA